MYKVKPYYVSDTPVDVPGCMYKLPVVDNVELPQSKEHKMVQLELDPEIIKPEVHGKPLGTKDHPILLNKDEKPLIKRDLVSIEYSHESLPDVLKDDIELDHKRIRRNSDKSSSEELSISEIAKLENRQEDILKRLRNLKLQVQQLSKTGSETSRNTNLFLSQENTNALKDIVISANPQHPPLSLFVLQQLLSKQVKMMTSCHYHSSLASMSGEHKNIFGEKTDTINRNQYEMVFTVMWKDVKNGPTLVLSPKSHVVLEGEGVIARFLARLIDPSYDSEDSVIATEIDQWVDTMQQFHKANNKERNAILKNMNSKLGKCDWLMGNTISLADVVMWSAVFDNDGVPANVKAWCQRCNNLEEFKTVLNMFALS